MPPKPAWGFHPQTPFSASRRVDEILRLKPMFQREPVSIAECFAFCSETTFFVKGLRLGLCPKPQQGTCSLHPFSASRRVDEVWRLKPMFQREPVSIAECFAFCSETTFFVKGLRLGLCPKPQQGTCSLHPFSASRRVDEVWRLKPMFQREPVSIAECFAFCSETTFFIKGLRLGL